MNLNLADSLSRSAERGAANDALLGARRLDYGTLCENSLRFAGLLESLGVGRGDHVAFLLPNVPEFTVCYFGCHMAAVPVVPLNVQLKAEEIAYHLDDSDAVALVVAQELLGEAAPAVHKVSGCRHIIAVSAAAEPAAPDSAVIDFATAMRGATALAAPRTTDAEDTAVILYTSGTTGRPKGAELTHRNLFLNAEAMATSIMSLDTSTVCLAALPLFHSFGQTVMQNAHIIAGAAIVLMPRFDAREALRLMSEHGVTFFAGVPTMYFAILHEPTAASYDLSALRYCMSGGAPMPVEVLESFNERFSVEILEGYGLSETSPVASSNRLELPKTAGSVGRPLDGVEFKLIDSHGTTIEDSDVPGEICIKGYNVMKRYYRKPDATAEAVQDGWFRTGDVATRDAAGDYFIVDRIKDLILRGGFNVYPREVEEVLYTHPAVTEAAVIGVPDERLGEEVAAFVACGGEGAPPDPEELIAHCREHLAAYKCPRHVEILEHLPVGPTGKILKRALRVRDSSEGTDPNTAR